MSKDLLNRRRKISESSIVDAECQEPSDTSVGTVFLCTADSDGATVEFDVTLEADDRIFAAPTNVVDSRLLTDYERSAVQALNEQNDFTLADESMDCGDDSVVLDQDRQMWCSLTVEDIETVYDVALTVRDVDLGTFEVESGDVAE